VPQGISPISLAVRRRVCVRGRWCVLRSSRFVSSAWLRVSGVTGRLVAVPAVGVLPVAVRSWQSCTGLGRSHGPGSRYGAAVTVLSAVR